MDEDNKEDTPPATPPEKPQELTDALAKVEELTTANSSLTSQVADLQKSNSTLTEQVNALTAERDGLQGKLTAAEAKVTELEKKVGEMEVAAEAAKAELAEKLASMGYENGVKTQNKPGEMSKAEFLKLPFEEREKIRIEQPGLWAQINSFKD